MNKVIAIKHEANCIVCSFDQYTDGREANEPSSYAIGWREPRYPVPAIPIHVYIGCDEVFTVEQHDDGVRADFGWQQPRRYFR